MADNHARMEKSSAALASLCIAFQRFEAVNGRALSAAEIAKVYDAKANRTRFRHPLVAGELGCYLSHIAIWNMMADSAAQGAVILEDDFAARPELGQVLAALAADPRAWDMVKLYARRPDAKMLDHQPLCKGFTLATPYQIPNTTLGYVLRKPAAVKLLARSQVFSRPIDEDHKRFWEHGLDIRLVLPPPLSLGVEAETGDTIKSARKAQENLPLGQKLRQGLKTLKYRLSYLALLHVHRLRGR